MPVYEYICAEHGSFEEMRPMAAFEDPCACPVCGAMSPRATALPRLAIMSSSARQAHATNERSAHEPKRSRDLEKQKSGKRRGKTLHRVDGSKSRPADRPWMLSY
ncbi:MAG: zinc ribbon domain-containing protein [Pseudomonadota bacterium]